MRLFLILLLSLFSFSAFAEDVRDAQGVALHGTVKYPADFKHLDYVNPDAPKGGEIRMAVIGGFDSLNAYILKGEQAAGLGSIYETLMESSLDEPNSAYGLLAESISYPDDKSYVSFKLRPEAKFNDGTPVTVNDVIWSFNTLKTKGHPFYRSYYREVAKVEKIGPREVKFTFTKAGNTELPMIMGQLPILPEHDWVKRKFEETTLEKPLGSGPYEIESFEAGRTMTYKRVKNYWGANLPLNVGRYNFDRIRYDYYRDQTVAHEAFLAGKWDFKLENIAKNWAMGYNAPVVRDGLVKKEEVSNQLPQGMQAFTYNLRREIFQDIRVREALAYAFDFEWSNKSLAFGAYHRTSSYYENSELAGHGLPSAEELKILEPYRGKIPDRVFTEAYVPPKTDGSGNNRDNMRKAQELLAQAGWTLKDTQLVNAKGEPFVFNIVYSEPAFERWFQPFARNLEKLGIKVDLRLVETAQYQNRLDNFDYDMIEHVFAQSISPGNEQLDFWGSSRADIPGSKNLCGIKDKVVDELVDKLIHAKDRVDLVNITKALDRVLLWNFYVIPQWHTNTYRIAYWDIFGRPATNPPYGLPVTETWWIDDGKLAKINATGKRAK